MADKRARSNGNALDPKWPYARNSPEIQSKGLVADRSGGVPHRLCP